MTDNFQIKDRYRAAAESVQDYQQDLLTRGAPAGPVLIALSNLAVAEAIHLFRQSIEGDVQAVVEVLMKERRV